MGGRDFTTGTATTPITYQYGRPACFVPKCDNCMYRTCCANAMPSMWSPTVTYSTTACGIDQQACNDTSKCNTCGKCNK